MVFIFSGCQKNKIKQNKTTSKSRHLILKIENQGGD